MLYIVSTPIGNLEDITLRAIRTLKEVDFIAAEDTRHCRKLLDHYQIKTPVISFHSYSDERKLFELIHLLKQEKNIALISDAGTPGISDPGYILIKKAITEGISLSPIPGATAFVGALTISGLPMDKFMYLGFLPLKKGRQTLLKELSNEKRTLIIYESPHRLIKTLHDLYQNLGDREVAVCRELTKIYEEAARGKISAIIQHFTEKGVRGEFVVVVGGRDK